MSYKLTYWNVRGRAEPIRLIFAAANVKYEDNRISKDSWPALKSSMPWGQVPVLEFEGKVLGQSLAICRFLAVKFGLAGSNSWEMAKCDEYAEVLAIDLLNEMKKTIHGGTAEERMNAKTTFLKETVPKYLNKFEKVLQDQSGDFLLGEKLSWADIILFTMLERIEAPIYSGPSLLDTYKNLKILKTQVSSHPGIKTWIETRPVE